MKHKMKLLEKPFNNMLNGSKEVEFRLYDDKRKQIKVGDTIEFSKLPDLVEKLDVEVMDLYQAKKFRELLSSLGYRDEALDEKVSGMYSIYTKEQEKLYGVIGIKIRVQKRINK